jgi:transposase InsO family protein
MPDKVFILWKGSARLVTILVISDYFTRWTESFPLTNTETTTVAHTFVFQFVCRFGVPKQVHTDQCMQFEFDLFKEICKILHIDKTTTTSYHPQSDGLVERFNRTLKGMLNKNVGKHPKDGFIFTPSHARLQIFSSWQYGRNPNSTYVGNSCRSSALYNFF